MMQQKSLCQKMMAWKNDRIINNEKLEESRNDNINGNTTIRGNMVTTKE